jgi:hypothetical protein
MRFLPLVPKLELGNKVKILFPLPLWEGIKGRGERGSF